MSTPFTLTMALITVFTVTCKADSATAVAETTAITSFSTSNFLRLFGLDCVAWDAATEAVLATLIFGLAFAVSAFRRKKAAKTRLQQKAERIAMTDPQLGSRAERASIGAEVTRAARRQPASGAPAKGSSKAAASDTVLQAVSEAIANSIRSGKGVELPRILDAAITRAVAATDPTKMTKPEVVSTLLHSALRVCAANHSFDAAIVAYDHVADRVGPGSGGLWSVLLYCIVEAQAWSKCKVVFQNLCSQGDPSGHDFVNMVRCYVEQQDTVGLQELLAHQYSSGKFIDNYSFNRALAACGASEMRKMGSLQLAETLVASGVCSEGLDAVSYNTLMKYSAREGKISRCFELHEEMMSKGIKASEFTFGILLDACVAANELDSAKKVFDDLCSSGLRLNVVHCTTFIKSLLRAGKLDEAATVLQEMSKSEVMPDLITYSIVIKAYSDTGDVSSALKMVKRMVEEGVRADDLVFNAVLTGCTVFPMKSSEVLRTFEALIALGMKPSTTSLSIMLKGLAHTQGWALSLQLLKDTEKRFGLKPETRLFTQLAQACIKSHEAKEVFPIIEAMLEAASRRGEKVDPVLVGRILRACVLDGELEVAVQLQQVFQKTSISVEPHVQKMVASALAKKIAAPRQGSLMKKIAASEAKKMATPAAR